MVLFAIPIASALSQCTGILAADVQDLQGELKNHAFLAIEQQHNKFGFCSGCNHKS
jgi:hypothetical protein